MEKETKVKLIIFGSIALCVLVVALLVMSIFSKKSEKENDGVNLATDKESAVSVEEMISMNRNSKPSEEGGSILSNRGNKEYSFTDTEAEDDIYQDEDEEVKRLQESLKQKPSYTPPTKQTTQTQQIQPRTVQTTTQKQNNVSSYKEPVPEKKEIKENTEIVTEKKEPVTEKKRRSENRFFRASEKKEVSNTVAAVVHGEQTVTNKGTLKMRLLEDLYTLDGTLIPKDTYVYGIASITAERMLISIQSVRINNNIYSLKRTVFDQDGLQGINVPDNVKAEIAKRAKAQSIQEADVNTEVGGLVGKGANAVVSTAKSLLSKDAQEIKITVKSNYKIYLK